MLINEETYEETCFSEAMRKMNKLKLKLFNETFLGLIIFDIEGEL